MKVRVLLIAIIVIFISACSSKNVVKQFTPKDLKSEVTKLNNISAKALMEGDYESTLGYYTNDAISMPSYQPMVRGIKGLKKQAEMAKQNPMKMKDFVLTSTDVWQEGKQVIDIGTYSFSMDIPQAPGGEFKDKGKYLTVYEVQPDGSLKIKAETWNSDINPWQEMMK